MKQEIYYENLPTINRNILVVEPTEVFLEWAKRSPDDDMGLTLKELVADMTAYLIPEQDADAKSWLRRNFKTIFEIELDGWCTDPSLWPKDRSIEPTPDLRPGNPPMHASHVRLRRNPLHPRTYVRGFTAVL